MINLTRETKKRQKNLTLTSCRKIVTSLPFFGFLANLEQSRGRIPDTESAKVKFSVIATFCLTKTENRTKKALTQLSQYLLNKGTFLDKKRYFFAKNVDISKIKEV